jgi:hypothetical protein
MGFLDLPISHVIGYLVAQHQGLDLMNRRQISKSYSFAIAWDHEVININFTILTLSYKIPCTIINWGW